MQENQPPTSTNQQDMPVSTITEYLGLPTSGEVRALRAKVDFLQGRVTALASKIERYRSFINAAADKSFVDRVDLQLAEIRNALRQALPGLLSGEPEKKAPESTQPTPAVSAPNEGEKK